MAWAGSLSYLVDGVYGVLLAWILHLPPAPTLRSRHVQEWIVTLLGRYSDSHANNQFRALQQFFKWHATEDPGEPA